MLNNLDRLLCKIAEYHPHWARALLVLNPRQGNETRLTETGVVIDAQGIDQAAQLEALVPVVHAVLDHAGDRAKLARKDYSDAALAGFDRVADHLARRAVSAGLRLPNHITLSASNLAISGKISSAVDGVRTLRGLTSVAREIAERIGAEALEALGREFPATDLSEGYVPVSGSHDPKLVRSFSREIDIPFRGATPAELAEATLAYTSFLEATSAEDRTTEIDRLIIAASEHLEDATRAPNGPAWSTLLMEIAFGHALDLGLGGTVCDLPSFDRYFDLRKQAGLS